MKNLDIIKNVYKNIINKKISNILQIEKIDSVFFKKNGTLFNSTKLIKNLNNKKKRKIGIMINYIKKFIIKLKKKEKTKLNSYNIDYTVNGKNVNIGSLHPLSISINDILNIFINLGFNIVYGPEIESEWYNFSSLNINKYHPSREEHDTFYLKNNNKCIPLRTHTSSVQIRKMEYNLPPIKNISYGKVYRNETVSKKSYYIFNQIEGFYIDKHISFIDLINTIKIFIKMYFKNYIHIRIRPSYFPFTICSIEIDVKKNNSDKWVEIIGCGMISPKIFNNVNINYKKYNGYAFGIGVERITMLKYDINDIRLFYKNSINFIKKFKYL